MKCELLRNRLIKCIGTKVREESVLAGKIRTNFFSAGSGSPVVLVHGHSITGALSWGSVISNLSRHFLVVAPDVVGYGESEKPMASYDRHFYCSWLRDFFDQLCLPKANLIGISQGGAICLQFALDNPDMVDRLVLINSAGLGKWVPPFGFAMSMAFRYAFPSYIVSKWNSSYMVQNPDMINKDLVKYGIKLSRRIDSGRSIIHGRGKSAIPFRNDELGRITQPTLFLCGENDRVMPHYLSVRAGQIIPKAVLKIIPDAGHSLFFDQPGLFNDTVVEFLQTN